MPRKNPKHSSLIMDQHCSFALSLHTLKAKHVARRLQRRYIDSMLDKGKNTQQTRLI